MGAGREPGGDRQAGAAGADPKEERREARCGAQGRDGPAGRERAGRDRGDYVQEVIATLPEAAAAVARWVDVFCDQGVFTVEEARRILTAARGHGLGLSWNEAAVAKYLV